MTNNVAIIVVYFGKLPECMELWMHSVSCNKDFNWIIFTDNQIEQNVPKNVYIYKLSLDEFNKLSTSKLGLTVNVKQPYKLCDFRPAYGVILSEYLNKYTHWGYCDLDMIFGDLRKYITDEILNEYDKLFEFGHLTIYKNNAVVNGRYCLENPFVDYKKVFLSEHNCGFDEKQGINRIYDYYNFKQYKNSSLIADVSRKNYKFMVSDNNYDKQLFCWNNGIVTKVFAQQDGSTAINEYMYIHFQKRKLKANFDCRTAVSYYITNKGFFNKAGGIDYTLMDVSWLKEAQFRLKYYKDFLNGVISTLFIHKRVPDSLKSLYFLKIFKLIKKR